MKDKNITFAEKAKLVGENWQILAPDKKAEYESRAAAEKEQYRLRLKAYQETDSHRQYSHYLSEFKQGPKSNVERTLNASRRNDIRFSAQTVTDSRDQDVTTSDENWSPDCRTMTEA